jgi:hypothetical protein
MTPVRTQLAIAAEPATTDDDVSPFASLESAQQYVSVLGTAVDDTQKEIQQEITPAGTESAERRQEALLLVNYKLTQLRHQLRTTGRLLNDLRMLRRLLLNERKA